MQGKSELFLMFLGLLILIVVGAFATFFLYEGSYRWVLVIVLILGAVLTQTVYKELRS